MDKTLTQEQLNAPRIMRSSKSNTSGKKTKRIQYDVDGDDDKYFEKLERGGESEVETENESEKDAADIGREWAYKSSGT